MLTTWERARLSRYLRRTRMELLTRVVQGAMAKVMVRYAGLDRTLRRKAAQEEIRRAMDDVARTCLVPGYDIEVWSVPEKPYTIEIIARKRLS